MRIVLTTFGSCGAVQSMLALSLALKAAGHDVLLAGPLRRGQGPWSLVVPIGLWGVT
jgi:hypothetical protein